MPLTIWIAAAAIATAIPLAWWSVASEKSPLLEKARTNLNAGLRADLRDALLAQSARERLGRPLIRIFAGVSRRFTPSGLIDTLDRRRHLAGSNVSIEQLLALKMLGAFAGAVVGVGLFFQTPSTGRALFALIATAAGAFATDVVLGSKASARQSEIQRLLADALDQITVCVEAGLSFEGAMARLATGRGPLADELGRTMQDIQIGMPRSAALQNLLSRTDVADLRGFVNAFLQAERYGIPIAHVLRVQSAELREKRRQRAEEIAVKIPVKLVFPVVVCILPALFVVLAGPAAVRISNSF